MNRLLLPNLFFEEELQSISTKGSLSARRLVAELGPVMGLLAAEKIGQSINPGIIGESRCIVVVDDDARPDDVPLALLHVEFLTLDELAAIVLQDSNATSNQTPVWDVVPWGWSESAILRVQLPGLQNIHAPNIDVVRFVNSRQFQSQCDAAIEIDGTSRIDSFGTLCHSVEDVSAAVRNACDYSPRGWVIKGDLSHAARNRLIGRTRELFREHRVWLESRFGVGESVYVEPWVERIAECGLQFEIVRSTQTKLSVATVRFVGEAEMLTDEAGRYCGSIVRSLQADPNQSGYVWQRAMDHCRQIAETVAELGYFGAIGFDCMMFRCPQHNRRWLRLSHDINGRLTMGRVALSLRGLLEPCETGIWVHAAADSLQQFENESDIFPSGNVRIIHTTCGRIGGKAAKTGTACLVSSNFAQLKAACGQILGQSVRMQDAD
ncbi:MAG: hypothetical protein O2856_15470 [Planctomycetota bacterium]|nr:hypothetical protein [Planctomycetota bacterium]